MENTALQNHFQFCLFQLNKRLKKYTVYFKEKIIICGLYGNHVYINAKPFLDHLASIQSLNKGLVETASMVGRRLKLVL